MKKRILISGIGGQSGSFLADMLVERGHDVHGIVRRSATSNLSNIAHLGDWVKLHEGDITDSNFVSGLLSTQWYDECYHLAAQSHVRTSFDMPKYTIDTTVIGTLNVLEAIHRFSPKTKMVHAASSEQFGSNVDPDGFQRETTPFAPNSPYAVGKLAAFNLVKLYRDAYNLHVSNGICFNCEGPRRGLKFVTRKITDYVARLYWKKTDQSLKLGNIEASRDWGYSADYMTAFYLIAQEDKPDDYVIATGETHTIKQLLEIAFGYINRNWQDYVEIDETLFRAKEVPYLKGDSSKARNILGWKPQVTFHELIEIMLKHDLMYHATA